MKRTITKFKNSLIAALVVFTGTAYGQTSPVVYHDQNPDDVVTYNAATPHTYNLDLNGDNTVDFIFTVKQTDTSAFGYTATGPSILIQPSVVKAGNKILERGTGTGTADTLRLNDPINSDPGTTKSWTDTASIIGFIGTAVTPLGNYNVTYGNFIGKSDKYVGVQFTDASNNIYYGWIGISVSNDVQTLTIKEWAYSSSPLEAGTTTIISAVNEQLNNSTVVRTFDNIFQIDFVNALSGTLQVVNMSGAIVSSANFAGTTCTVNMQGAPSGVYSMIIESNKGSFAKKVFVK